MNKENIKPIIKPIINLLILIIVLVVIAFGLNFLGFSLFGDSSSGKYQEITLEDLEEKEDPTQIFEIKETDVVRGSGNILLIEYSDLDCPFCKAFHKTAQKLVDDGKVAWVYRHFPLPSHQNADEGAVIAECVRINVGDNEFNDYIDTAFEINVSTVQGYRNLGIANGLTNEQISACLDQESEEFNIVISHIVEAQAAGVSGTPGSFIVNTKNGNFINIPGALPIDLVEKAISGIK